MHSHGISSPSPYPIVLPIPNLFKKGGSHVPQNQASPYKKAAVAAAASLPVSGQQSITYFHPTTTPLFQQAFQNTFSANHPDFTHRAVSNGYITIHKLRISGGVQHLNN